jgi:pimeloyl-ACP methyl ester carboxylesterase
LSEVDKARADTLRRVELTHDRRGRGEPLVLVHGIGSRWQVWEPVLDALAGRHEVIALDLPGFGASGPLPAGIEPDVPGLASAVEAFCARAGLERPHVAGNSMGGAIALELARRGTVRSATAVSPAGFWTERERVFAQRSLRVSRELARRARPALPALVRTPAGRTLLFGQTFAKPWRLERQEAIDTVDAFTGAPGFDAAMARFTGYRAPTEHDGVPVTVAWGDKDRLLLFRQAARARRLMPRARHVTLPGCGHAPFHDDPELVAAVLLAGAA